MLDSMTVRRQLRPSYLATDSIHLWVVDDVQPVAALIDVASAAVIRLVTWRDIADPPPTAVPGARRVVADGGSIVVVDEGSGDVIELTTTGAHPRPRSVWANYDLDRARRFSAAWRLGRHSAELDGPDRSTRRFAIAPTIGTARLEARTSMEVADGGRPVRIPLGVGWVTAGLVVGGFGWACVRRAPLRPWTWRPAARLLRVAAEGAVDVLPDLDIADISWPRPDATELDRTAKRRFEQMRKLISAPPVHLTGLGVRVEAVELTSAGVDSTIDIVFTTPARPGLTLVRTVELFDEVGAPLDGPANLHEDLNSGFLPPATAAIDGVLHV